ncbi:MAG TPA: FkbM family methyltransferase, partial [Caulobacteraceae bacterium]|nr:FkbM family methyltransferase [Caulobacteraceae bacterium]
MSMTQFSSLLRPSTKETASQSRLNTVSKTIQVTTGTLEAAFDKYQRRLGFRRPFLKMDTQGKDVDVARGAGDRLQQFAAIMTELAVKRLYDGQPDFRQALEFYFDRGFEVAAMLPTHPHFPQMIEVDCVLHNPALTDRPQAS